MVGGECRVVFIFRPSVELNNNDFSSKIEVTFEEYFLGGGGKINNTK